MTGPPLATGDLPGVFGRYRIKKRLGKGGMGAIYLVHGTTLDRQVALKVPSVDADTRNEWRQPFYREARAAAAFHHPNLRPVYDVGEIGGRPYLTMDCIDGRKLAEWGGREQCRHYRGIMRSVRGITLKSALDLVLDEFNLTCVAMGHGETMVIRAK